MNEFTILKTEQIFGDNALEIFKKRGTICAASDYAIARGCYVSSNYYASSENTLAARAGWWWAQDKYSDTAARAVAGNGSKG